MTLSNVGKKDFSTDRTCTTGKIAPGKIMNLYPYLTLHTKIKSQNESKHECKSYNYKFFKKTQKV